MIRRLLSLSSLSRLLSIMVIWRNTSDMKWNLLPLRKSRVVQIAIGTSMKPTSLARLLNSWDILTTSTSRDPRTQIWPPNNVNIVRILLWLCLSSTGTNWRPTELTLRTWEKVLKTVNVNMKQAYSALWKKQWPVTTKMVPARLEKSLMKSPKWLTTWTMHSEMSKTNTRKSIDSWTELWSTHLSHTINQPRPSFLLDLLLLKSQQLQQSRSLPLLEIKKQLALRPLVLQVLPVILMLLMFTAKAQSETTTVPSQRTRASLVKLTKRESPLVTKTLLLCQTSY